MKPTGLLCSGFVISLVASGARSTAPPVTVSLRTSWPSPPFLLELIETISIEEPDAFFPLLDIVTNSDALPGKENPSHETLQQLALQTALSAGYLSKPGALEAVQALLALHSAQPKIVAFYQHYLDKVRTQNVSAEAENCGSWVDWYGGVICDVDTLIRFTGAETQDHAAISFPEPVPRPEKLAFDHVYPSPDRHLVGTPRTAILYASLQSPNFRELHSHLLRLSSGPEPRLQYIFRPIPAKGPINDMSYLSGYGVTLDLKKTDYLVLDDRLGHRKSLSSDNVEEMHTNDEGAVPDRVLPLLEQYPLNPILGVEEHLTKDEIAQIGILATQLVSESDTPLETLRQLVQDFPRYAISLSRRIVPQSGLLQEIAINSRMIQPGINAVWLNGAQLSAEDINPHSLLRLVRKERDIMLSLTSLGLLPNEAFDLITHPSLGTSARDNGVVDGLFDASDRPEGGDLIFWWNDIEKDSRYARWQSSLFVLLRPLYPGQAPNVRLNMYNVVFVLDLARSSSLHFITNTLSMLIDRSYPVRFGIIPIIETEESVKMAKVFYYLVQNHGRQVTMRFFSSARQSNQWIGFTFKHCSKELVDNEETKQGGRAAAFDDVIGSASDELEVRFTKARKYAKRLDTTVASSPDGHIFINGKYYVADEGFLNSLQSAIGQALQYFRENVHSGVITDAHAVDIENHFYDLPTTMKRRNRHIVPVGSSSGVPMTSLPNVHRRAGLHAFPSLFIYPVSGQVPLSIYIIADLDAEDGLNILRAALTFSSSIFAQSRLTFLHNPAVQKSDLGPHTRVSSLLSHLLCKNLLSKVLPSELLRVIGLLGESRQGQPVLDFPSALNEVTGYITLANVDKDDYRQYLESSRLAAEEVGFPRGASGVIVNGRVRLTSLPVPKRDVLHWQIIGPIPSGEFTAEDYQTLQDYELAKRVRPILDALGDLVPSFPGHDRATAADLVSMVASVIFASPSEDSSHSVNNVPAPRNLNYKLMNSRYTAFTVGNNASALHHFAVILDPLSDQAQRYTSLFEWLSHIPTVTVEFHLQPPEYLELPLKRFYRYNLIPSLAFNASGHELHPQVIFRDLPVDPIYTLGLDEPSSWLVRPREAQYDLDNIQLSMLSGNEDHRSLEVIYELDYLIIGGHARETGTNAPPRGVQLQLTNGHGKTIDDTLVVENLGYLQFKAMPGVYRLEIREGHSREVFQLESAGNEGWQSPTVEEAGNGIAVTTFEGVTLYPRLSRLPGREHIDVLEVPEEEVSGGIHGIYSRISSILKSVGKAKSVMPTQRNAEINIFTVASGLLYERFASIMILSVLRNTRHTVKFWFIENFLSPSFLEFIPQFADEYGFQYELVTYKWPTWLRPQREKQRVIWAYKILFLDVLFPMDLDKVIFVDADQIIRTDLKELIDLDLHGAPYGYTPMGDDNKEMEGFRFWKTGYWAQSLRGRPYHISALYVVDLVRFRQMAAGDILRSHYQQLSADPNSLANLDQDLPNNLQGYVPIYSLHEDWLWCETWCSKERLYRAKTIDLCQNPLTKEPKLARARQIPEWEQYDSEIARFTRRLTKEGRIHASDAAADVNQLANAGSVQTPAEKQDTDGSKVESPVRDEL
ncbi:UDP-glucose:glycoprotein glucosyltransferase-domain-containing protein [Russula earlei]|uniref:UDP-glucose:glycoprotein glucosyltransferase-domain-containing protein n=1 Tax=Russula earlei TaxID=71964 RepID=A0ACC0UI72_9AGAM|nr:UDP-glucose:glycoprotein glucosyltransferase-domain-containing protein [Russula earlei]